MHGCISTGKEANVYHATTADGEDLAIKIYKTSVLVFKDRDRYLSMRHCIDSRTYPLILQHIVHCTLTAYHQRACHQLLPGLCITIALARHLFRERFAA